MEKRTRSLVLLTALAAAALMTVLLIVGGCSSLPSLEGRTVSTALTTEQAQATLLGKNIEPRVAAHPGVSGLHPLGDPLAAFASRMLLARYAQRTIDAQYYIWQNDITGTLLLAELERAAQRGVRVRLLLDDNGIHGLDETLAALAAQPNVEVRLFNPFTLRSPKWANYITAFSRLNHRMHNKSFTVDNQATVVGGRNVGDTYFGATDGVLFADLDVLAVGPVVPQVSKEFDNYWASRLAYPIDRIVDKAPADALARFHARAAQLQTRPAGQRYRQSLTDSRAVKSLLDHTTPLIWAATQVYSDQPAKALGEVRKGARMIDDLSPVFRKTERSLELVSPYLVLGAEGAAEVADMARRGVDVRLLTNSLAATDVAAVHAGYVKRRRQLLKAGVKLYELRRTAGQPSDRKLAGPFGSSGSSLHAKTFAVDRKQVFIGSFNFDPRSANINTEMGFLIESQELAQDMRKAFEQDVPRRAYEVRLDDDGNLYWLRKRDEKVQRYNTEPDTTWLRRMSVRFLKLLPIEWLL